MTEPRTVQLPEARNFFYHIAGLGILLLNKIRHSLQGYKSPRTFPITEITRAIDYDFSVVDHWLSAYSEYTGNPSSLAGRTVLELGPGADLGIGLITLMLGARKYNSLDINNLVSSVPPEFYADLFKTMRSRGASNSDIETLKGELSKTSQGNNDRLNYVVRDDFDIAVFKDEGIDTVFSQAAFEHFDDIPLTFSRLGTVVRPGTCLIAEVDLNTHTRWIRDIDPLNIYRFGDFYYDFCRFPGSPNRLTASDYKRALEQSGWRNIHITPLVCVDDNYLEKVQPRLASRFRKLEHEMGYLSIMVCATKN